MRTKMKELRNEKGLTLEKLGLETNISTSYIYQIEKGNSTLSYKNAIKISSALYTTPDELFMEDELKIMENEDEN